MNRIIKEGEEPEIYRAMRRAFEGPGTVEKFMRVTLQPGQEVKAHCHKRHAVLYYPRISGPVIIHPAAGTLLYLPPLTIHEVPVVESERVSIAMLIDAKP